MTPDSIYIFNPKYKLKKDKNRVIIANRSSDPLEDSFMGFVHPMYSIIFSLFEGTNENWFSRTPNALLHRNRTGSIIWYSWK